jgi:hypothetical protein
MAILKGLHGSTGFLGLTHRGRRGIVHESVGDGATCPLRYTTSHSGLARDTTGEEPPEPPEGITDLGE